MADTAPACGEGGIVDWMQEAQHHADGIVINAAARAARAGLGSVGYLGVSDALARRSADANT